LPSSSANNLKISLKEISKRFLSEWIFKNVSLEINPAEKIVITGPNGSGKSTLLQVLANYQAFTKGQINYLGGEKEIDADQVFEQISIAAPYLELIEDFSLSESIEHQKIFKPFLPGLTTEKIVELSGLGKKNAAKEIRLYSSGMKQRAKLTLAVLADCPLLLLDEPCSNFDTNAIKWYNELVREFALHKTIIVCSNNVREEFSFCDRQINIEDYKEKISL
jgi:ABC-type multidrug transport system ATPase subunit